MGVYASAAVVAVISAITGGAIGLLLRAPAWSAPALGLSACLLVALACVHLPGGARTAFAVLALAVAAAALALVREGSKPRGMAAGAAVAALVLLGCSLPFIAYWRIGELGPGYTADLVLHMGQADAIRALGSSASVTPSGYPVGPHALVAALADGLGLGIQPAFLGFLLAIPVLTGVSALAALEGLSAGRRVAVAALVGLPYLPVSYYLQASFKELVLAYCFLAFALILRDARRRGELGWREGLALSLVSAGGASAFGLPALAWPGATLLVLAALEGRAALRLLRSLRARRPLAWAGAGVALLAAAIGLAGGFLGADGAGAYLTTRGIGGNYSGDLSPLEAFGVWPSSDFRFRPRSHEAIFWLVVAFGGAAGIFGLARFWRRRETVLVAAVLAGLLIYAVARPLTLAYNSGKALVIVAPLLALIAARALLELPPRQASAGTAQRLAWVAVGVAFFAAAAGSSAMALRAGVPRPQDRASELAALRPLLEGERTLYLGRSDWSGWDLRGARLAGFQRTTALSRPLAERPRKSTRMQNAPADVDSIAAGTLDRFRYVVAPRSAYGSVFPANFEPVRRSRSFVVWERRGATAERRILGEGSAPGAVLGCAPGRDGGVAFVRPRPLIADARAWRRTDGGAPPEPGVMAPGESLVQTLKLGPGLWELSLSYASPVELRVRAGALDRELPADVDDEASLFAAGRIPVRGAPAAVRVEVSARGRRAVDRDVRLGRVAATRIDDRGRLVPLREACGRYVDWLGPEAGAERP